MMRSTLEVVAVLIITWLVLLQAAAAAVQKGGKGKPNCNKKCGNLTMVYPFGIKEGCYLNKTFKVTCVDDVPSLAPSPESTHTFTVLEIRLPNLVRLEASKTMAVDCGRYNTSGYYDSFNMSMSIRLPDPFTISSWGNRFRALGCDTTAKINNTADFKSSGYDFRSQCDTQWMRKSSDLSYGGLGQCQIALPEGSPGYMYNITNEYRYTKTACTRHCSYAFLAEERYEVGVSVLDYYVNEQTRVVNGNIKIPLVGEWVITDGKCENNKNSPTCGKNTWCNYTSTNSGYNCRCNKHYREGNPYLPNGCHTAFPTLPVAIAGGIALAATLGASSYGYRSCAKRKLLTKLFYDLLQQVSESLEDNSTPDDMVEPDSSADPTADPYDADGQGDPDEPKAGDEPRQFKQEDLKKAISLYRKGRRVALWAWRRMVSRATMENNQAVEIRKYTVQDKGQLKDFVKGIRTLFRTAIHPNVARLLGFCPEDSSLIYSYFSDKTLHDRLDNSRIDSPSWEERLKIAVGTARGLAFAHRKGIYHGDVKSSKILLDENCNCKIVDFGVVRVWRRNKLRNSSKGYVDPVYLKQNGNLLTSTMDVYSFGVVLVELITGQDPSAKACDQRGRSLVMRFKLAVEERRLKELVDDRIWEEEKKDRWKLLQCLLQNACERRQKEGQKCSR